MQINKSFIVFALLLVFASSFLSAGKRKPKKEGAKIDAPKSNEVMFVGRVTVHNKQDLDFFVKTRGVSEDVLEKQDVYYLPYVPAQSKVDAWDVGFFESQAHFKNGEIFLANYEKTKTNNFCFTYPFQYYFHGDTNLLIYLPSGFMVKVPKGEKYVYIGDFEFFVEGKDFKVVDVKCNDNYDAAKDEVVRLFGDKAVLTRAPLLPVDTSDAGYIEKLTVVQYF